MAPITRERAFELAERYLAEHAMPNCAGVREVLSIEELVFSAPVIYGFPEETLADYWIAYAKRPEGYFALESSTVVLVSKLTGEIAYAGSAHDEG
jgi:hypothetical protein